MTTNQNPVLMSPLGESVRESRGSLSCAHAWWSEAREAGLGHVGAVGLADRGPDQVRLLVVELDDAAVEQLVELVGVEQRRDQAVAVGLGDLAVAQDGEGAVGRLLDAREPEVLEGPLAVEVAHEEERVPLAVELLARGDVGDRRGGELGDVVGAHVGLDGLADLLRGVGVHAAGRLDADDQGAVAGLDLVGAQLDGVDHVEQTVVLRAGLVGELDLVVALLVEGHTGDVVGLDRGQALEVVGAGVGEAGDGEQEGLEGTHWILASFFGTPVETCRSRYWPSGHNGRKST